MRSPLTPRQRAVYLKARELSDSSGALPSLKLLSFELDCTTQNVNQSLSRLMALGWVRKVKHGSYRITRGAA